MPTNPVDVHARTEAEAAAKTYDTGPPGGDARAADNPALTDDRYQLGDELARGGMGRIVRGTDRRLGREVAVKVLLGDSAQLAARFDREAQVIARLQHPSIVPIHDRGHTADGRPFYTMKLVEGRTLDDAIRDADATARTALVPHVVAVVDAIAYAHSQRIIHRDLKPLNVLVGAFGETLVIDWGLAKELGSAGDDGGESIPSADDPLVTRHGQVVGTPAYMPPEQAAGRPVDERADVYSLGAMLYHVLAGQPPFAGSDSRRILVDVVERTPKPLDELRKDLPDDLVAIVDRAMARDPAQRYPTAQEMAADLRRHQAGQLVSAHRYTLGQRLARLVRRHPAAVTIAISLLAIVVLAVYSFLEIKRERDLAIAANTRAETQREAAEGMAQHMLTDLRDRLEPIGKISLLDAVGKRVDDYYKAIPQGGLGDSSLARRARTLELRADVARASGDRDAARALYEQAAELGTSAGNLDVTTHVLISLGDVLVDEGKVDDAEKVFARARGLGGPAAARVKANVGLRTGMIAARRGDNAGALAAWEQAAADFEALAAADPQDKKSLANVVTAHGMSADMRWQMSETDRARDDLARGRAAIDRLLAMEPDNPAYLRDQTLITDRLGEMALWEERLDEAETAYRDGLAVAEKLAAYDPDNAQWQTDLAFSVRNLAVVALNRPGHAGEALTLIERALEIQAKLVANDPDDANGRASLSTLHLLRADALRRHDVDRGADAIAAATRARDLRRAEVAKLPDDVWSKYYLAESLQIVGELLSDERPDEALAALTEGLAIASEVTASDDTISEWRRTLAELEVDVARLLSRRSSTRTAAREHASVAVAALERLHDAGEIRAGRFADYIVDARRLAK